MIFFHTNDDLMGRWGRSFWSLMENRYARTIYASRAVHFWCFWECGSVFKTAFSRLIVFVSYSTIKSAFKKTIAIIYKQKTWQTFKNISRHSQRRRIWKEASWPFRIFKLHFNAITKIILLTKTIENSGKYENHNMLINIT